MAYETIIVEIEDEIALIRLNRPEALNALNSALITELAEALREADGNDKIRCVVLTGSEKAFAAGADIKEMSEKSFVDVYEGDLFGSQIAAIRAFRKPMIAAVSGYALGGGCELAMICDFIIAAENAKFGQPEINLGVIPGIGGTQRLTRFVGKSKAMDMILTGREVGAEEALAIGLANYKTDEETALAKAMNVAEHIAAFPQLCMQKDRLSALRQWSLDLPDALKAETEGGLEVLRAGSAVEGASRFTSGQGRGGALD